MKVQYPGIATSEPTYLALVLRLSPRFRARLDMVQVADEILLLRPDGRVAFIDFRHVTFVRDAVGW